MVVTDRFHCTNILHDIRSQHDMPRTPWPSFSYDYVIERGAVDQFCLKFSQQTPHSSPMRARYGASSLSLNSDLCSAWVNTVLYAISRFTGPFYICTWMHIKWRFFHSFLLIVCIVPLLSSRCMLWNWNKEVLWVKLTEYMWLNIAKIVLMIYERIKNTLWHGLAYNRVQWTIKELC